MLLTAIMALFAWIPPPGSATAAIARPAGLPHLPAISGSRRSRLPLVVIDPGHGGHDPGSSTSTGTQEKKLALALALVISDALLADGHVRVALTRADDRGLFLSRRREIARALGADLLLSIHCDSAASGRAHGASLYTLAARSSDPGAAATATRENEADRATGGTAPSDRGDLSSILTDLARRETLTDASTFASLLGRELAPLVTLRPRFHQSAALIVLKAPDVPSVLLEAGYISNAGDLALLRSAGYRQRIARGVTGAVRAYFAQVGPARNR